MKENNTHSLRHGAKKSNIEKNQNPRIIPCEKSFQISEFLGKTCHCNPSDDFNRVVLEPEEGVPDSDYINASYVDVSSPYYVFVHYSPEKNVLEF